MRQASASIQSLVNSETPPFLIIHGMVDLTVPYCQSKVLKIALESAKIQSELIPVRDGGHGRNVFKGSFNK